eukprot:8136394-Pyramimonas_sp.AAC.1
MPRPRWEPSRSRAQLPWLRGRAALLEHGAVRAPKQHESGGVALIPTWKNCRAGVAELTGRMRAEDQRELFLLSARRIRAGIAECTRAQFLARQAGGCTGVANERRSAGRRRAAPGGCMGHLQVHATTADPLDFAGGFI